MKKYPARLIILLTLLLVIPCILHAETVRWEWTDAGAAYYRWQLDGEDEDGWNLVPGHVLSVDTPDLDPEAITWFHLQSSSDGKAWSRSAVESYGGNPVPIGKRDLFGMRMTISPYSIVIFDFFNGHEIEGAKYLTLTDYAASVAAELYWKTVLPVSFHLDAEYTFGLKGETVIPNASDVHLIRLGGGADLAFMGPVLSFYAGISGGELISINAHGWNPASYLGARCLIEFSITDRILLGFESKASVSYQDGSEPLLRSLTWMVDPLSIDVTCRF